MNADDGKIIDKLNRGFFERLAAGDERAKTISDIAETSSNLLAPVGIKFLAIRQAIPKKVADEFIAACLSGMLLGIMDTPDEAVAVLKECIENVSKIDYSINTYSPKKEGVEK